MMAFEEKNMESGGSAISRVSLKILTIF